MPRFVYFITVEEQSKIVIEGVPEETSETVRYMMLPGIPGEYRELPEAGAPGSGG